MYAGGVSGGVWKTTNGGQYWNPMADEIANIAVNSMAMRPDDPETIYIGTGEGYFREEVRGTWLPLRGAGIFVSRDGAATWERLESTDNEDFHWVNDLIVSTKDPDRIYAATRTGVHISTDGGASWEHSLVATQKGGCLDLEVRTDLATDWLFASCGTLDQATVYRRKIAAGTNWEPVLSQPGMGRTTLAIAPSRQNIIYALSASNVPGPNGLFEQALHAVYRSTSGGAAGSWVVQVDNTDPNKVNTLLLTNPITSSYTDCGWASYDPWIPDGVVLQRHRRRSGRPRCGLGGRGRSLPFRQRRPGLGRRLLLVGCRPGPELRPRRSARHRLSPRLRRRRQHQDVHRERRRDLLHRQPERSDLTTGIDGICNTITSRVFFQSYNNNMGITQFYHGTPYPGGERYIGGTQDNGTVVGADALGPERWRFVHGGDGGYTAVDPTSPNLVYAESQRFGFVKSTDGGSTFTDAISGVNDGGFLFITPFTMDLNEPQRLWTGGYRLWRTDNGGLVLERREQEPHRPRSDQRHRGGARQLPAGRRRHQRRRCLPLGERPRRPPDRAPGSRHGRGPGLSPPWPSNRVPRT